MLIPLQPRGRLVTIGSIFFLVVVVSFFLFRSRDTDDVVNYVLKRPVSQCVQQQNIEPLPPPPSSTKTKDGAWEFMVGRDAENYGLSQGQCRIAFPKLFAEIEKSVAARKGKPITAKELSQKKVGEGMVRVIVHRGEVSFFFFFFFLTWDGCLWNCCSDMLSPPLSFMLWSSTTTQ